MMGTEAEQAVLRGAYFQPDGHVLLCGWDFHEKE